MEGGTLRMNDPTTHRRRQAIESLSSTDREIVKLILDDLTLRQIASRLAIDDVTARARLCDVLDKLAVADRCELIRFVTQSGFPSGADEPDSAG
jgi:DNA-binding NarL/FixJ family response regulator